jgi:replicative superfamily II helicase
MNDKEKIIEEMAKDLKEFETDAGHIMINETLAYVKKHHKYNNKKDFSLAHIKTIEERTAEELYNAGYRKIPDNAVVLTVEKVAELEKENDEKHKRIMELEQDLVHEDANVFFRECNVVLQENKIKAEALKQFAERLKDKDLSIPLHKEFIIIDNKAIEETLKELIKGE